MKLPKSVRDARELRKEDHMERLKSLFNTSLVIVVNLETR